MQNIAGYPTDLTVTEPTARVTLNGVTYEAKELASVTVTRELPSSLPAQTTGVSGITAATGDVEFAVGADVAAISAHPWDSSPFPPKPADTITVDMGYGDAVSRQFTGVIDSISGSALAGDVSSQIVDGIDRLNKLVSFPAMLANMPSPTEGASSIHAGNEPTFTTDRILRACGFNATPPVTAGAVLSVPLMGSAWPEVGTATDIGQNGFPDFTPGMRSTHWGIGANSIEASYDPYLPDGGHLDRPLQLTMKVDREIQGGGSGDSYIRAYWGSSYIELAVTDTRAIKASAHSGGSTTTVLTMTATAAAISDVFTLRVDPSGAFVIYANKGVNLTGGSWSIPGGMSGADMSSVQIHTPHQAKIAVGGFQVNFGATSVYASPQTANLTPATYGWSLPAFPRIDGRNALDLLKEQSEAECSAMWIDEHGVFTWVNREVLAGSTPVATLTALDDILDIGWESNASGVRSGVELVSRAAAIKQSRYSNRVAWQGSGESLESGDKVEEFIEPGADMDWIGVDETFKLLPDDGVDWFNRGRGSWWGGVETDGTIERWASEVNGGFSMDFDKLGDVSYKLTVFAGTPTAGFTIEQRTRDDAAASVLWKSWRNEDLPILRCKAVVEWKDKTTKGAWNGPADSAMLTHEVGPWIQEPVELQELADWLSFQLSMPRPVIRDLAVIPDPRRQLGDIVWVEDAENMRIRLKLLITKISTTVAAGSMDQTVGGRILEVASFGPTNDQLDAHAADMTNDDFDILWEYQTNYELDADPLGRG